MNHGTTFLNTPIWNNQPAVLSFEDLHVLACGPAPRSLWLSTPTCSQRICWQGQNLADSPDFPWLQAVRLGHWHKGGNPLRGLEIQMSQHKQARTHTHTSILSMQATHALTSGHVLCNEVICVLIIYTYAEMIGVNTPGPFKCTWPWEKGGVQKAKCDL